MGNEHITQARLAVVELAYQVEVTLKLLEQLPDDGGPTSEQLEALGTLMEHRGQQIHEAIAALQGRVAGAVNLALMRAEAAELNAVWGGNGNGVG